jgi:hypothetical protein
MTKSFKKLGKALLADTIGDLDTQIKVLEADLKSAKAEFKARGLSEASGDLYAVKAITGFRVTLDKQAVVAAMQHIADGPPGAIDQGADGLGHRQLLQQHRR